MLFFRLNLEVVFGVFLACFGRAVRHALRRGPPAVHRNCEKRIKYMKKTHIFYIFFRVLLARAFAVLGGFLRLFGLYIFGVFLCFLLIFLNFLGGFWRRFFVTFLTHFWRFLRAF